VRTLRIDGETDDAFRDRAKRAVHIAHVLVEACLANRRMREFIADPTMPYSEASVRSHPTVRIEYEQAIAIGGIGEALDATRHKHWGAGPWVLPLEPDDEFFPDRITYLYRENSLYNRRFEQRRRLKELLGRQHRPLVEHAHNRYITKAIFLRDLTDGQAQMIRRILNVEPGDFWRACKGKLFLSLPPRTVQLEFDFESLDSD
jgi:hypothetical protein